MHMCIKTEPSPNSGNSEGSDNFKTKIACRMRNVYHKIIKDLSYVNIIVKFNSEVLNVLKNAPP